MYKLKLARGLSYAGYDIKATKKEPFVEVEDEATVDYLVESKHFELAMNAEAGRKPPPDGNVPSEQWTVPQLQAFAAEKGIDITGLKWTFYVQEQYVIAYTRNTFSDPIRWPKIPEQVRIAVIMLAEQYAANAAALGAGGAASGMFKSERLTIIPRYESVFTRKLLLTIL